MNVETGNRGVNKSEGTARVDIELRGALVARAGARQGRVVVPEGSTVADATEQWADEYGARLRFVLLDDDHLRADIDAVRIGEGERLAASQPVADGDTIQFSFRD